MTQSELVKMAAIELCLMMERDPQEQIAVPAGPDDLYTPDGKYVPLWETVTPGISDYLIITEAVKRALRSEQNQPPVLTEATLEA
jgi:hypothetical protein